MERPGSRTLERTQSPQTEPGTSQVPIFFLDSDTRQHPIIDEVRSLAMRRLKTVRNTRMTMRDMEDLISRRLLLTSLCLLLFLEPAASFSSVTRLGVRRTTSFIGYQSVTDRSSFHGTEVGANTESSFDPLNLDVHGDLSAQKLSHSAVKAATTAIIPWLLTANTALAAESVISKGDLDPENFQPICPASDGFYRFLQGATEAVVGPEKFVEYGPLIAGGLLRVRLELCVVESFFNEAVGPFIRENGVSWILPLHETVETFLAGTIFCLATTFILVGSTKLLAVIVTYADAFIGGPCRLLGGFSFDRALGKPVTLDIGFGPFKTRVIGPPDDKDKDSDTENESKSLLDDVQKADPAGLPVIFLSGSVKALGEGSKVLRDVVEGLDLFVGRYLVLFATAYIAIKFLHYKVFPGFPPV